MREREDLIEAVAGRVGDGDSIDWKACAMSAGADERRWLDNLRVLAEVGRVARSGELDSAGDSPAADATVPLAATSETPLPAWGMLQPLERIGRGGFGEVYRAWDTRLHRQVALKLLRGDSGAAAAIAPNAIAEARLLARAEHPHVVRIYGVDSFDGCTGIWMEFVQGVSLYDLVAERGPLTAHEVARIGVQLCSALDAVHAANVVHQDVKPQNVLCEASTNRIVLMDFGAGRWRHSSDGSQPVTGTPRFTAPEVLEGAAPSPQSDVYGLGALLYYLLTGQAPVSGTTAQEVRRQHSAGERQPLSSVRPDLPPAIVSAVEGALENDRARRFRNAAALSSALESAPPRESVPPSPPATARDRAVPPPMAAGTATPSKAPSRRAIFAIAAAFLVVAVVFAALLLPRDPVGISANVRFVEAASGRVLGLDDPITSQDRLQIQIEPSRAAYVYVLNVDGANQNTVMFPMAGGGTANPLAGSEPHLLPGTAAGAPLGWTFSSDPGTERFLVVASAERLVEFEEALANLPAVALGGGLTARPADEEAVAILTRGVLGVAKVEPAAGSPGSPSLFDLAHRLAGDSRAASRVWVQEMRLVNPGR